MLDREWLYELDSNMYSLPVVWLHVSVLCCGVGWIHSCASPRDQTRNPSGKSEDISVSECHICCESDIVLLIVQTRLIHNINQSFQQPTSLRSINNHIYNTMKVSCLQLATALVAMTAADAERALRAVDESRQVEVSIPI